VQLKYQYHKAVVSYIHAQIICTELSSHQYPYSTNSKIFAGNEKFTPLWKVVIMVLILSHGIAAVESGFSVNKELLVKNMEDETIVAQRVLFHAIRVAGMDVTEVDISHKMIGCVRQSHSV